MSNTLPQSAVLKGAGDMAKLHADFRSDLATMARQYLVDEWGTDALQKSDDDILISFFDSFRRKPAIRPRTLWIADDFKCPPDCEEGWRLLQGKVVKGVDLHPHLSKYHAKMDYLDGLLNALGVHHLHLGTVPDPRNPAYVKRDGPVLFARITADDFYAINVYPHGAWENASVIKSLHRNWPDSIKSYRAKGTKGETPTETENRNLRKNNGNIAIEMTDGTVYMPIDGGVASSGTSLEAVIRADMLRSDAENLQTAVQDQLEKFLPSLRAAGYADQAEIRASLLEITSEAFRVAFPEYGVLANVKLEGGWFHRKQPEKVQSTPNEQ